MRPPYFLVLMALGLVFGGCDWFDKPESSTPQTTPPDEPNDDPDPSDENDENDENEENENEQAEESLGSCIDHGDPDGPDEMLGCMVPVGDGWTADEFKRACEDDWRSWGVHYNADACPEENLIGYCEGLSGGELIGASWDSASYTATLYYYTTDSIIIPLKLK